jgi:predicted metal-binding protein
VLFVSPRGFAEGDMSQTTLHHITVCTSCRQKGDTHQSGRDLIAQLRRALNTQSTEAPQFDVAGAACMAGCTTPCTVAFHAPRKASYLFGNIATQDDLAALVEFAKQYALLRDGWCSSVDRPARLRKATLARIPASFPPTSALSEAPS